jgi:hypothetical protein
MKTLISLLLISGTLITKAQDQLFKKDNSKLLVKILEVNSDEIKFKMYNNLNGPSYVETKANISLIIYENGNHEVVRSENYSATNSQSIYRSPEMSFSDSIKYFKHSNSISLNFLNFFNNEVGLLYQKDFFKSQFNIQIPLSFGLEKPSITQSVYFNNYNNSAYFNVDKKLFEVGFGINYYPSLSTNINYFIGPVFKYAQYQGSNNYSYYISNQSTYQNYTITQKSTLSRYSLSITNGVVIRTKSRLTTTFFGSLGFKNDIADKSIKDPNTNVQVKTLRSPLSLYFWTGFNVGFSF